MSDVVLLKPLTAGQIAQAFPLLSVVDSKLSEGQWRSYANAVIADANAAGRTGILTAQSNWGYIFALAVFLIKPDLRELQILEIENFAVAAILGSLTPARALLDGLEAFAVERGCSCITISLLNPYMRRWLRERGNPAIELFRSAGFRGEQLRLRKCFRGSELVG
jgi:ribosomal protein S18 acetylase RimI-like enzyme